MEGCGDHGFDGAVGGGDKVDGVEFCRGCGGVGGGDHGAGGKGESCEGAGNGGEAEVGAGGVGGESVVCHFSVEWSRLDLPVQCSRGNR